MLESYGMIILQLLGALGLLVFGMRMMSDALQKMVVNVVEARYGK